MNPVGVITGAGSGIGSACAVEFARLGAHLTLASLPTPGLAATAAAVEQAGGQATPVEMDVRDPFAVREVIDGTVERNGVRVTMIEPGAVDTPLTRNAPKVRPLIEWIDPLRAEDVARAVVWAYQQPGRVVITELGLRPLSQPDSFTY
jgi:NADP-dependent 3-hydroxy acid dehydrogenase YdfG